MKHLTALALLISLSSPAVLLADKPAKKDKDKGKGKAAPAVVVFHDDDRNAARQYYTEKHGPGNCPPGLAKKNNGCLPPGQAKKRYVVGQRLPRTVVLVDAPADLIVRLRPLSPGYRYVVVDGDVVKLAVATRLVVDVIEGFAR